MLVHSCEILSILLINYIYKSVVYKFHNHLVFHVLYGIIINKSNNYINSVECGNSVVIL